MKLPMVHVIWLDACSGETNWLKPREITMEAKLSHTVGFLVKADKKSLVVALNYDGRERVADMVLIPKVNVVKIKKLK